MVVDNKDMVSQELVNYVRGGLQKGKSSEEIKTALLNSGWSEQDIAGSFNQAVNKNTNMSLPEEEHITGLTPTTNSNKIPWLIYSLYSIPPAFLFGIGVAKGNSLYYLIPFIVGALIGAGISELYRRKLQSSKILFNILIWSNVLTWLLPVAGFSTGFASGNIYFMVNTNDKNKILILSHIAVYLSITNLFLTALIKPIQ